MRKQHQVSGAGFVIVSKDLRKVVLLRKDGKADLPKGSIEQGETILEAAKRESQEESGIMIQDSCIISNRPHIENGVAMFVSVQGGKPSISANPKTGLIEHDWCGWVPWHIALREVPSYLRPALLHARAACATVPISKEVNDVDIP